MLSFCLVVFLLICSIRLVVCHLKDMIADFKKKGGEESFFDNERLRFIPRSMLENLKNCTILIDDTGTGIAVSIAGFEPDNEEHVRAKDLHNLRNLRVIHGSVKLEFSQYSSIKSLDAIFPNLREIHGDRFIIRRSQMEALNLTLVVMNVSKVQIERNPRLCFLENFETNLARKPEPYYYRVQTNRDFSECKKEHEICDAVCADSSGCLGPGKKRCAQCRAFRAGLECVETCTQLSGFYRKKDSRVCGRCHPECRGPCTGPRSSHCYSCKTARDGHRCVGQCPVDKFFDKFSKTCRNCSERCFHGAENMTSLCSGPGIENCFHGCTGSRLVNVSSGKRRCRDCHAVCQTGCIGLTEHDCLKCESVKTNVSGAWECRDFCQAGYSDISRCLWKTKGRICYETSRQLATCYETINETVFLIIILIIIVVILWRMKHKLNRENCGCRTSEDADEENQNERVSLNGPSTGNPSENRDDENPPERETLMNGHAMDELDTGNQSAIHSSESIRMERADQLTAMRCENEQGERQFRLISNKILELNNIDLSLNDKATVKDVKMKIRKRVASQRKFSLVVQVGQRNDVKVFRLNSKWIDEDGNVFQNNDPMIKKTDKFNVPLTEPLSDATLQLLLKRTDSNDVILLEVKLASRRPRSVS